MDNDSRSTDAWESARQALRQLLALLDDPQPGLFTWNEMVQRARDQVLKEMRD